MPLNRISKELQAITKNPPRHCSVSSVGEDTNHWEAMIIGPVDTPYAGGTFRVNINFPSEYPFKPPKIVFCTRIYHPNIANDGAICLDMLKQRWSPAVTISQILMAIYSLLQDPQPDSPIDPEIAQIYQNHRETFNETARDWTKKYAISRTFN